MMTTDTLRAAITAALRRRDPNVNLDVTLAVTLLGSRTSTAAVVLYGSDGAVIDVVARASDDARALRGVAFAVGLRVAPCPACGGRGRRAYGREVEDGCDECECSGVVANDPAEEVERLREERQSIREGVACVGASCDREITIDGVDLRAARRSATRFDVERIERERDEVIALERERCAGLVREIPACQPGAKATAARRWLDDRVAACVRAIEVDDETATCARALVREARERAKAAEADVARLEFALQCEATRHEETRAAARSLIGVLGLYDPAIRDGLLTVQMRYIDDAREALRKIVDGDR